MKKYNVSAYRIRVIKHLYDKATNAVLFNGSIGQEVGSEQQLESDKDTYFHLLFSTCFWKGSWQTP